MTGYAIINTIIKKVIASLKENNTMKLHHFIVIFRTLQLCYLPVNLRLYGKHHHHGPRNFQSVVPKVDSDITSGFVYVSQKLQIIATAGAAQVKKRARRKRGLGKSSSFLSPCQALKQN